MGLKIVSSDQDEQTLKTGVAGLIFDLTDDDTENLYRHTGLPNLYEIRLYAQFDALSTPNLRLMTFLTRQAQKHNEFIKADSLVTIGSPTIISGGNCLISIHQLNSDFSETFLYQFPVIVNPAASGVFVADVSESTLVGLGGSVDDLILVVRVSIDKIDQEYGGKFFVRYSDLRDNLRLVRRNVAFLVAETN